MDANLHFALAAALQPDELADALDGKRGKAARKVLEKSSTDGEIEEGMILGSELHWTRVAEGFTNLYDWGSDDAAVRDLSGIEEHPELELINLPFSKVSSLEPLRALEELKRLRICVTPKCDLGPLRDLPNLERVSVQGATSAQQADVLGELAARGIHADGLVDWKRSAAPFADRMLKLAVVGALAESGALELPDLLVIDQYDLDEGNLARVLAALAPGDRRLAKIKALGWASGGFTIQHKVYPQWHGESETFDVTDLGGIEALTKLAELKISPLGSLPKAQVKALRARGIEVAEYH